MATRLDADFADIDLFRETLELYGWEGRVRQIDSGRLNVKLSLYADEQVTAVRTHHSLANIRDVVTPPGARTFGLVLPDAQSNQWCSRSFDRAILQLMPADHYTASNAGGHLGYQLSVSQEVLEETMRRLDLPAELANDPGLIELDQTVAERLVARLDKLWDPTAQSEASGAFSDDVLPLFLDAFCAAAPSSQTTPSQRRRAFDRAREYVEAHLDDAITLADICRYANVSSRTLSTAFGEQFGISPMAYVKFVRLNAARDGLVAQTKRQTTVVDVANECGFWHMGQFAADYKALFDELPSSTLERAPRGERVRERRLARFR